MQYTINDISTIILAGGKGSRIGNRNKGLLDINGETFIAYLLKKLSTQTHTQVISANNDIEKYQHYQQDVIKDKTEDYQGPLSGIVSCKSAVSTSLILTVPCDSPMIPDDLSSRLLTTYNKKASTQLCVAHDGKRLQNLFMLFDADLLEDMQEYFLSGHRSVYSWINRHTHEIVDFSDKAANFTNVNDDESFKALMSLNQTS